MRSDVDTVRGYLAAFARGDPDDIASFVAADFVNEHLAELGSGSIGRVQYRGRLPGFLADFDGLRYEIDDVVSEARGDGDSSAVVVRYRLRATHDGVPVDVPGIMWCTVVGGLITRRTDLWDSLSFLRQTGQS